MKPTLNSKKFRDILNQVPPNYYQQGVKTNLLQRYWHTKKWKTLEKLLPDLKGKLLDIGCADGTTIDYISQKFPFLNITGIDYYKKAIDFAKKTKPHIKFIHADVHSLPFKKNDFDIITSVEVLEHLENPQKALEEIYRVLRPGGFMILGQDTNSLLFRSVWWLWSKWKGSVWENSHISCCRPDDLFKLVKKSGFKIKNVEYVNLKMEVFVKAQKIKR